MNDLIQNVSRGAEISYKGANYTVIGRPDMEHLYVRSSDGRLAQIISLNALLSNSKEKEQTTREFAALEIVDDNVWKDTIHSK